MKVAPALALVVLWCTATVVGPFSDTTVNDFFVYRSYAELLREGALLYLDFGFEYPPIAALPMGLASVPGGGETGYEIAFGVLMLGCALVGQQLAARLAGGGREGATVAWLLALTPILIGASLRTHFDLLPIALALGALLALARERPTVGFALLGVGTMTKLFPALLVPLAVVWLVARGDRAVVARGLAAFAAVVVVVSLPFLGGGYVDQFEFHLERPVQIESTPATVLFALGGSEVTGTNVRPDRFKSNGLEGGAAGVVQALFALASALALLGITALAARRPDARHLVLCTFAALLAFVALGKVLSPQFVIWLAPFAALAWAWGEHAVALLAAGAIALTHVEFPSRYFDLIDEDTAVILLVAGRNVLLLLALAALVIRLRAAAPARSPRRAAAAPSSARAHP